MAIIPKRTKARLVVGLRLISTDQSSPSLTKPRNSDFDLGMGCMAARFI
jgi:hypothetical protein